MSLEGAAPEKALQEEKDKRPEKQGFQGVLLPSPRKVIGNPFASQGYPSHSNFYSYLSHTYTIDRSFQIFYGKTDPTVIVLIGIDIISVPPWPLFTINIMVWSCSRVDILLQNYVPVERTANTVAERGPGYVFWSALKI